MPRIVTFDSMPSALGLLIDRVTELEQTVKNKLSASTTHIETNGKRIATATELAKYLKRPLSAVYQMQHRGIICGIKMPGSRRLYFDLDDIDNTFKNVSAIA